MVNYDEWIVFYSVKKSIDFLLCCNVFKEKFFFVNNFANDLIHLTKKKFFKSLCDKQISFCNICKENVPLCWIRATSVSRVLFHLILTSFIKHLFSQDRVCVHMLTLNVSLEKIDWLFKTIIIMQLCGVRKMNRKKRNLGKYNLRQMLMNISH